MGFGNNTNAPDMPPPGWDAQALAGWPASLQDAYYSYLQNASQNGFSPMGPNQFRAEIEGSANMPKPSPMQTVGQVAGGVGAAAATNAAGNAMMSAIPSAGAAAGAAPSTPVIVNGMAAAPSLATQALPIAYGAATTGAALHNLDKGRPNEAALWTLASGKPLPIAAGVYGLAALRGQGSHPETRDRRTAIDEWQNRGFISDNERMTLGNGTELYFGDPAKRGNYQVDLDRASTDQEYSRLIGAINPLATLMTGSSTGDYNNADFDKRRVDMAGMLVNALMNAKGGSPIENALSLYQSMGLDHDTAYGQIAGRKDIEAGERDAMLAALDSLYQWGPKGQGAPGQASQVTPWWTSPQGQAPQAPQTPSFTQPPSAVPYTQGAQGLKGATTSQGGRSLSNWLPRDPLASDYWKQGQTSAAPTQVGSIGADWLSRGPLEPAIGRRDQLNVNPVSMSQSLFPSPIRQAEQAKPKPPVNIGQNLQSTLAQAGIQTAPLPQRQGVNIPTSLPEGLRSIIYRLTQERQ
jgi:hypothetical protein